MIIGLGQRKIWGVNSMHYDVESYWSQIAGEIRNRTSGEFVAGDDDPFHRYKRDKFVRRFLPRIDVTGKRVLEVGPGPGGNLKALADHKPRQLIGIDISESMLTLATENLRGSEVELKKTDGHHLPLPDASVDIAYTVTVLQHNVDEAQLGNMVAELCRVTTDQVILFEDIGSTTTPSAGATYAARPVESYRRVFAERGFCLVACEHLGLRCSRFTRKIIGKLFLRRHHEGEPIGRLATFLLNASLPVAGWLDRGVPDNGDLTMMMFINA
jgi:SAM-dependent methyltransferase